MRYEANKKFLKKLKKIHGNDYEPLENYTYAKVPILVRHVLCGHEYKTTPDNILSGKGCKPCGHKRTGESKKKTLHQFKEEVFELVSDEYIVLGDYEGANTKTLIKHNISECGYNWETSPSNFLSGSRCPVCADKNKGSYHKKTQEQVADEVSKLSNNEIIIQSTYQNYTSNIKLKHNVKDCGYVFEKSLANFNKHPTCPRCDGRLRNRDTDMFKDEINELVGDEYTVLGEYIDTKTHITMQHNTCKSIYGVSPSAFLCGNRCPTCNKSRGEAAISKYLEENDVKYLSEYRIDDCRNERPLPFDFAILDNNNNPTMLIEFDGKQHFEPVEHFGGDKKLEYVQCNDNIKKQYCANNNIKLLEIPYWEFGNVDNILSEHIIQ